jgi:hypothetical protein
MLADLGTKALHAPRLEKLKELMSMGTIKEEEKEDEVEERKDEEKKEKEMKNWAEAAQAVRLITMAAAISTAKAVEEEEKKDGEGFTFERMVVCYTVFVVLATLLAKRIWKVGVHLVRSFAKRRTGLRGGSLVRFPPVLARLGFDTNPLSTSVPFILYYVCIFFTFSPAQACVTQQNFANGGVKK